jgi:hypothetical protein
MDDLERFPISGDTVCRILKHYSDDDVWVVKSIETISKGKTKILGDIWERVGSGPVKITNRELFNALMSATQVISLDMHLLSRKSVELLIEDGELVSQSLTGHDGGSNRRS